MDNKKTPRLFPWRERTAQKEKTPPRVDALLQRAAWVCQIGVLVLAIFGYFYTIRPIYQKQLLDEAIAQKELQLRSLTASLNKTYKTARDLTVRSYVSNTTRECLDIFGERRDKAGTTQRVGWTEWNSEYLFNQQIESCLMNELKRMGYLNEIRVEDRNALISGVKEIAKRLTVVRDDTHKEFKDVPARAKRDPNSLPPPKGMRAQWLDVLEKTRSELGISKEEDYKSRQMAIAIEEEQTRIIQRYTQEYLDEVRTLNTLKYPSDGPV